MVHSLAMTFEVIDGVYYVDAPWLAEPASGATWYDAYWAAMRTRRTQQHDA